MDNFKYKYKSPVSLDLEFDHKLEKELIDGQERYIARGIMSVVNLEVDEDELIRALKFDRGQYEEGFRDGFLTAVKKMRDFLDVEESK